MSSPSSSPSSRYRPHLALRLFRQKEELVSYWMLTSCQPRSTSRGRYNCNESREVIGWNLCLCHSTAAWMSAECTHARTHAHTHTHTHAQHTHNTHTHTRAHVRTRTYARARAHTHTMHTHTHHAHTHTPCTHTHIELAHFVAACSGSKEILQNGGCVHGTSVLHQRRGRQQ